MNFFKPEFSKKAYIADFAVYLVTPILICGVLWHFEPHGDWPGILVAIAIGFVCWTLLEYALHRFVLHGLEPFTQWHAQHHLRPHALIGTPTVLSLSLILVFIFLPALFIENVWLSAGLTLGVLIGYAVYSVTHHALHHWRAHTRWLKRRKQLHAIHHHARSACAFGVITSFWDRVFGTCADESARFD